MKAIVMAGGEGTRLRPVTTTVPKPMIRLLDRPVLDYILHLLKDNGINDVCITLGYMPEVVESYIQNAGLDINITTRTEKEPLGTAGSVKNCEDFIGGEDFLVISGDGICDFDLKECIKLHREKNAEVTIVTYSHPEPLEYGLVVTRDDGKIERFIEKPSWDKVCTNCINTGIYIMSGKILKDIPKDTKYDFGKDLFPKLMAEKRRLYGICTEGYWCDIGSPEAYLQCSADMLQGRIRADIRAPKLRNGVWSRAGFSDEDVIITPPVFIGKNVIAGKGARIGPNVVLGENSAVSDGANIKNSIIDGAIVKENGYVSGAVMCKNALVCRGGVLEEGTVLGEGSKVGENSIVFQNVKIWPGKEIPSGARIKESIITGMMKGNLAFGAESTISGEFGIEITPEECITVGCALASFGKTGICSSGGNAAKIIAEAISCGVKTSGSEVIMIDSTFDACAAFSARLLSLSTVVFVKDNDGMIAMTFFDSHGDYLPRDKQRKIEASFTGEIKRANGPNAGGETVISGTVFTYMSEAVSRGGCRFENCDLKVNVAGTGAANRTLKDVLQTLGCTLTEKKRGVPSFQLEKDGFKLSARDENFRYISSEQMMVVTALAEFENGCGKIAVPYAAPAALDILAKDFGTRVLRIGRDGEEAQELYRKQMFMRDGIFAAVKICSVLQKNRESLAELFDRMPSFSTVSRRVQLGGSRGNVMRILAASCAEMGTDFAEGLRIDTGKGFVQINPCAGSSAIRIKAECGSEEAAQELCCSFEKMAREIDSSSGKSDIR